MLIDQYLKDYHFNEFHKISIAQSPEKIYTVVKTIDFTDSRIINCLFTARGLPKQMRNLKGFIDSGFILLEEKKAEELLIGFILCRRGIARMSPPEFITLEKKGYVKGVWNFYLTKIAPNTTLLSTETRVYCTDKKSWIFFALYWLIISRISGLIRIIMLKLIKRKTESAGPL